MRKMPHETMNAPVFVSSEVYRPTGYLANHPLGIPRISSVHDICAAEGWLGDGFLASPAATVETLTRLHDPAYVAAVREVGATGKATREMTERFALGSMENPAFAGVFERASTSVGGSILSAERALEGRIAYHPAGGTHHGRPDRASGFCYFNDPAFAILTFLDAGLERVLYLDLDAHHGDGVQDIFADDPRVATISTHEAGRWPGTGLLEDRGGGRSLNLPVPAGFRDAELALLMEAAILPFARGFAPQALVLTTGADALAGDPLSKLELTNSGLWTAVEHAVALCPASVVLGGGGYNPWTVARCWAGLWARLSGQPIPGAASAGSRAVLARLECDLVDEDEVEPVWLADIADAPDPRPVRPEVEAMADAVRGRRAA